MTTPIYKITDEIIEQLIDELAQAVSDSYQCDNDTLKYRDIRAIVERHIFGEDHDK